MIDLTCLMHIYENAIWLIKLPTLRMEFHGRKYRGWRRWLQNHFLKRSVVFCHTAECKHVLTQHYHCRLWLFRRNRSLDNIKKLYIENAVTKHQTCKDVRTQMTLYYWLVLVLQIMESVFTITNNVIQASREAIDSAQKNTKALNRYTHIYMRFSSVLDIEE